MWELDPKEGWAPKNWCFQTMVLERTLGSPLDSKEIKPVNPKGNQSWIVIGRPGAKAEVPILWPPDANSWLIGKDPDAGKDSGQKEKGATADEMAEWHHHLNEHETDQTLGGSKGQGSLACCSPCCHRELDMTEWLNNNWTAVGFRKLNSRIFISYYCRIFFSTNIYFLKKILNIWLYWFLIAACRIFSCTMQTLSCNMWDLVPCPGIEPGPLVS